MMIIINDNIIIWYKVLYSHNLKKRFDIDGKMCDSIDFWRKANRANTIGLFLNIQNQTNFLVMKKSNRTRLIKFDSDGRLDVS